MRCNLASCIDSSGPYLTLAGLTAGCWGGQRRAGQCRRPGAEPRNAPNLNIKQAWRPETGGAAIPQSAGRFGAKSEARQRIGPHRLLRENPVPAGPAPSRINLPALSRIDICTHGSVRQDGQANSSKLIRVGQAVPEADWPERLPEPLAGQQTPTRCSRRSQGLVQRQPLG